MGGISADRVAEVLRESVQARPELMDRGDRCRAVLNDALAQDSTAARREVGLLVAAVEDGVPAALRTSVSVPEVDGIVAQFRDEHALAPDAARWAVETWSGALRSLGLSSAPVSSVPVSTEVPVSSAPEPGDLSAGAQPNGGVVTAAGDVVADAAVSGNGGAGDLARRPAPGDLGRAVPVATAMTSAGDLTSDAAQQPLVGATDTKSSVAWWRRPIALVAAIAVVVVVATAGVVAVASSGGGSDDEKASKVSTSSGGASLKTDVTSPVAQNDGVKGTRTWTLGGKNGSELTGRVVLSNSTTNPVAHAHTEVFPKSLVDDASKITFDPKPDKVVKADPIVEYDVTVPAKGKVTLSYTSPSRPREWTRAASRRGSPRRTPR